MRVINQYLLQRGKRSTFHYNRPVPSDVAAAYGKTQERKSLGTADVLEARKRRDQHTRWLEAEWDRLRAQMRPLPLGDRLALEHEANAERRSKTRAALSGAPPFAALTIPSRAELKIIAAGDRADVLSEGISRVGQIARARLPVELRENGAAVAGSLKWAHDNTEEGRALQDHYARVTGRKSYVRLGEEFLRDSRLSPSTVGEYERAYKRADRYRLQAPEQVDRAIAGRFLQRIADEEGLSVKSLGNVAAALSRLWKSLYLDRTVWRDHEPRTSHVEEHRAPWTDSELAVLLEATQGHWLYDVIIIALHTGARREAIARVEYDASTDIYWMPALKREPFPRFMPCHPGMRGSLQRWCADRKEANSIGNRFREFRNDLGLRPPDGGLKKDFHSLRSNVELHLKARGLQKSEINLLTGRAGLDIADRNYSFGKLPQDAIHMIHAQRRLVETIDWSHLLRPEQAAA